MISPPVESHDRKLDFLGCHQERQTNGYHCHQGPYKGLRFNSKQDALDLTVRDLAPKKEKLKRKIDKGPKLSGKALVLDGDTIRIGKTRIDLFGIDAPEQGQICEWDNADWTCGIEATKALRHAVAGKSVRCVKGDNGKKGRIVAVCFIGKTDLNALMVRRGWALAYRQVSSHYVNDELVAKVARAGMWRSKFLEPWKWRQAQSLKKK
ncbi:MAG: thermonuclease family protein [Rhodospirillaceae bacterium]|jgi:endonuclease YncB( thermonuclease family)|nr:thermonuclease family protein [Rhodospirillaceae bacterium]